MHHLHHRLKHLTTPTPLDLLELAVQAFMWAGVAVAAVAVAMGAGPGMLIP